MLKAEKRDDDRPDGRGRADAGGLGGCVIEMMIGA